MKQKLNIAVIGGGFMGKAHSNGWRRVGEFFPVDYQPVLKVLVGNRAPVEEFAARWGYEETSYDWRSVVARADIDVVSIVTPPFLHKEIAVAALNAGKHVVCEKPFALNYHEALEIAAAAERAPGKLYLNHNYRRLPAVAFAKQLIDEGRLGEIYSFRGAYLNSWTIDPGFPLVWHMDKAKAGGGALYDTGAHVLDLARYLAGEPVAVTALSKTFIKQRPLPASAGDTDRVGGTDRAGGTDRTGKSGGTGVMGDVTVDDMSLAILELEGGAIGNMEANMLANGCKNKLAFEVYGAKGALAWDLERLDELKFYEGDAPDAEKAWKTILVTNAAHPYMKAWWPDGNCLGYEHSFVNAFYDFLEALSGRGRVSPDHTDGVKIMRALNAIQLSAALHRRVAVEEIV